MYFHKVILNSKPDSPDLEAQEWRHELLENRSSHVLREGLVAAVPWDLRSSD